MSVVSDTKTPTREYRSPLRVEQAAETHSRILNAAAELFASHGYGGTSLVRIGELAGVSVETVKASGVKRDLLLAALENSFAGCEGIESLAAHARVVEITADSDSARYLAGIMRCVAESNRRSSRLWTALVSAAVSDPQLGAKLDGLQRRRRADILLPVDELRSRALAPSSIPRETHADTLSFALAPTHALSCAPDWRDDLTGHVDGPGSPTPPPGVTLVCRFPAPETQQASTEEFASEPTVRNARHLPQRGSRAAARSAAPAPACAP